MKTAVALIIFNRPEHTERVFEVIRQAKPSKLFVIADGPRPDRPGESEKCAAARAIIDRVDWHCEVLKNFSDTNLTCGVRVSTGISWVFNHVEEAIILEDDCVPHASFFPFCSEMLERYRDDKRVMHISGNNFWSNKYQLGHSYGFSRYTLSWGWATWRRAWQHHDLHIQSWPEAKRHQLLKSILGDDHAVKNWTNIFQRQINDNYDTWDYQWTLACWLQHGLSIIPNVNLVSNIGFGTDATHTFSHENFDPDCPSFSIPTTAINFPLTHPNTLINSPQIDGFIQETSYDYQPKLRKRIKLRLYRLLKKPRESNRLGLAISGAP
jgi:hypothetical protein